MIDDLLLISKGVIAKCKHMKIKHKTVERLTIKLKVDNWTHKYNNDTIKDEYEGK